MHSKVHITTTVMDDICSLYGPDLHIKLMAHFYQNVLMSYTKKEAALQCDGRKMYRQRRETETEPEAVPAGW